MASRFKSKTTLAILILLLPALGSILFSLPAAWALVISVVLLWFTESLPLPASGLLVPGLACLYGILAPKQAFLAFGNQILFLFIGSFLLAESIHKWKLDQKIVSKVFAVPFLTKNFDRLAMTIGILCWFLSMWISNTATCAIMTPLVTSFFHSFNKRNEKESFESPHIKAQSNRLLLTVAYASSVGGIATPVGSPPNLLALHFLNERGIFLSFFDWMKIGLPVSIIMLIGCFFLLKIRFKVASESEPSASESPLNQSFDSYKFEQLQTLLVFLMAVLLWMLPGLIKIFDQTMGSVLNQRLPMAGVALLTSIILFMIPTSKNGRQVSSFNLEWKDASKIDWGIIMLFGGGLTLGKVLDQSGIAQSIAEFTFSTASSPFFLLLGVILVALVLSELGSNTASAAILFPALGSSIFQFSSNDSAITFYLATAFAASFGFMLPVSTPPNAIVFGTGHIKLKTMIRTGIYFDILGIIIIATWAALLI